MLWTPPDEILRTHLCIRDFTNFGTKETESLYYFSNSSELAGKVSSSALSSYFSGSS